MHAHARVSMATGDTQTCTAGMGHPLSSPPGILLVRGPEYVTIVPSLSIKLRFRVASPLVGDERLAAVPPTRGDATTVSDQGRFFLRVYNHYRVISGFWRDRASMSFALGPPLARYVPYRVLLFR